MQKIVTRWKQKDKGGLNETRYDVFMALSHVVWNLYSCYWPAHAEAFRHRKNIKFLCALLLMTDLQIRKRWECVQLLFFWKDTLYYLESISNATKFTSGRYNLGIQVCCENSNFVYIWVTKTTYCNDQIKTQNDERKSLLSQKIPTPIHVYFSYVRLFGIKWV